MIRMLVGFLVLAVSAVAQAQYSGEIAYTVLGGKSNLVIANADGTKPVTIYQSSKGLAEVDMKPGGGMVALTESRVLKIISYTMTANGPVRTGIQTLDANAEHPDFSPDGTKLVYGVRAYDYNEVRVHDLLTNTSKKVLELPVSAGRYAWLLDGTRIAYSAHNSAGGSAGYYVNVLTVDSNSDPVSEETVVSGRTMINDVDSARTANALLVSESSGSSLTSYNLDTNTTTYHGVGLRGRFNSDDTKILSVQVDSNYLQSHDLVNGGVKIITKRGNYGYCDSRP